SRASSAARSQDSPAPLRRYLSDPASVRHRREAQGQIDEMYDRAISDLKKRAAGPEGKGDRALSEAIVSLLEGLKRADNPVLRVGFKATQTAEPATAWARGAEKAAYQACLRQHPDLKDLERTNG